MLYGLGLALMLGQTGCGRTEDTAAVAAQVAITATDLDLYYGALTGTVIQTISLYEVDAAVSGVPFAAADRKLVEATRDELANRERIAACLGTLASALGALAGSKTSAEVEAAATALGNSLIEAKALSSDSAVPENLGTAGRRLLEAVRAHDEKRAAVALDGSLRAVTELFAKERPVYDSLARTELREAGQIAGELIKGNQVDVGTLLRPALRPFDLSPLPAGPPLQGPLQALALTHLQERVDRGTAEEAAASAAMLGALQEMGGRVHLVGTGGHMPARTAPASLRVVEAWEQAGKGQLW